MFKDLKIISLIFGWVIIVNAKVLGKISSFEGSMTNIPFHHALFIILYKQIVMGLVLLGTFTAIY